MIEAVMPTIDDRVAINLLIKIMADGINQPLRGSYQCGFGFSTGSEWLTVISKIRLNLFEAIF